MNTDTTTASDGIDIGTSDGWPQVQNVNISGPKRCARTGCTALAGIGSRYCEDHQSSLQDLGGPSRGPATNPGPSNRALQRQLDRLEGKLDAILAALNIGHEEDD